MDFRLVEHGGVPGKSQLLYSFAKVTRKGAEGGFLQRATCKSPLVRTSFHFYGMMDEGGFPGGASGKESACQGFPGGLVK